MCRVDVIEVALVLLNAVVSRRVVFSIYYLHFGACLRLQPAATAATAAAAAAVSWLYRSTGDEQSFRRNVAVSLARVREIATVE